MNTVEIWKKFEVRLTAAVTGNPFTDVYLFAVFTNGKIRKKVRGFYNGENTFIIRFMPQELGEWQYTTESNCVDLSGLSGSFLCIQADVENHGPVITKNQMYFEYSDGASYMPFGTTLYGWHFQDADWKEKTLELLKQNRFNKVRMTVFPIWNYMYNLWC